MSWAEAAGWLVVDLVAFLFCAWPIYWLLDLLVRFLLDHGL